MTISITADFIVFSIPEHAPGPPSVLLVKRRNEPFKGMWALPGGFVNDDEELDVAASRELREETGLDLKPAMALHEFSTVGRDPRGRIISFPFLGLVKGKPDPEADDDAEDAQWVNIYELPALAFDHSAIISEALKSIGDLAVRDMMAAYVTTQD